MVIYAVTAWKDVSDGNLKSPVENALVGSKWEYLRGLWKRREW